MLKKVSSLLVALILMTSISLYFQWPDEYLHIVMCDVGQGDGILITFGFTQMLIDGGPDEKILECLSNHMPFWDRTIEIVMVTHADLDHIGGIPSVLTKYNYDSFMMNPTLKTTDEVLMVSQITKKHPDKSRRLTQGDSISLFHNNLDAKVEIIWPEVEELEWVDKIWKKCESKLTQIKIACLKEDSLIYSENSLSISGFIEFREFDMIFTGDIEEDAELAMVSSDMLKDVEVVKIPHHGSKTSSSDYFIDLLSPETAVVSLGKNNRFGHPHTRVIDTLRYSNIDVYRTDDLGTFEIVTDGQIYWIQK